MWKEILLAGTLALGVYSNTNAQGYVDQDAVATVLESQVGSVNAVRPVTWHKYEIAKKGKTAKAMLQLLQAHIDSLPGERTDHRMEIVELSNRVRTKYMVQRRTILIPDFFPVDFRAYSPYPMQYAGAANLSKLFVIDKYTQTFGAYESGQLVRWGLVSSGHDEDLTPAGRYNFNWKDEYRESSEAPEGEVWKMRWVVNIDPAKGIHCHQYALPIAAAASHGCVRLTESDALWNFHWAESTTMKGGKVDKPGTTVIIINYNPVGLAAQWQESYNGNATSLVNLPADPMAEPKRNYASK